jgi:hypothetical protein
MLLLPVPELFEKASLFLTICTVSIGFFMATLDDRPSSFLRTSWILLTKMVPLTKHFVAQLKISFERILFNKKAYPDHHFGTFLFLPFLFLADGGSIRGDPFSFEIPSGGSSMETAACRWLQCRFPWVRPTSCQVASWDSPSRL